jgi:hypothetical protein
VKPRHLLVVEPHGATWWQDALVSTTWLGLVATVLLLGKACLGEPEGGGEEGGSLRAAAIDTRGLSRTEQLWLRRENAVQFGVEAGVFDRIHAGEDER